jgi:hypothetical protein
VGKSTRIHTLARIARTVISQQFPNEVTMANYPNISYGLTKFRKDRRGKTNNRELNREFFQFAPKSIEFCPKSANFALEQGINKESYGYLSEPRINPE